MFYSFIQVHFRHLHSIEKKKPPIWYLSTLYMTFIHIIRNLNFKDKGKYVMLVKDLIWISSCIFEVLFWKFLARGIPEQSSIIQKVLHQLPNLKILLIRKFYYLFRFSLANFSQSSPVIWFVSPHYARVHSTIFVIIISWLF